MAVNPTQVFVVLVGLNIALTYNQHHLRTKSLRVYIGNTPICCHARAAPEWEKSLTSLKQFSGLHYNVIF